MNVIFTFPSGEDAFPGFSVHGTFCRQSTMIEFAGQTMFSVRLLPVLNCGVTTLVPQLCDRCQTKYQITGVIRYFAGRAVVLHSWELLLRISLLDVPAKYYLGVKRCLTFVRLGPSVDI